MKLFITFLIAAVASVVVNLIILSVGKPLAGLTGMFGPLSVAPVIMWSVLGTIGATIVCMLVRKFSRTPKQVFIWISVVALLLSFIPDVLIKNTAMSVAAGVTWTAIIVLMLMHIAAAIIDVTLLQRCLPAVSLKDER